MSERIAIRDIRKRYPGGTVDTLKGLTLDIKAGSFFTLFGPSGCGKSTLLRCIAGLETPDSGEIAIGERVVFSSTSRAFVPTYQRRIGMVFPSYAIWPHMTVVETVMFPLEAQGDTEGARARAQKCLETVGLGALSDRYASKLSGGQQQRVALARAIVGDPKVLLLDEPLSNLDAALRDQMRAELHQLQRRLGITAIYVTHDQSEALSMSDRIAVMRDGEVVEIGTPDDIYARPQSSFTAKLIGGANVLQGTVRAFSEGGTVVDTTVGRLLSSTAATGEVQVFIRPERLRLAGDGETQNVIAGRVRERRFAGETTEVDLGPPDGGDAWVLRCRVPAGVAKAFGETIRVTVEPDDLRIFRKEEA